jgi:hypothetical protein
MVTQLLSTTVTSSGRHIVLPRKDPPIVVSTYDVVPDRARPVPSYVTDRSVYCGCYRSVAFAV